MFDTGGALLQRQQRRGGRRMRQVLGLSVAAAVQLSSPR